MKKFILVLIVIICLFLVVPVQAEQEHKPFDTGYELFKAKKYLEAKEAWEKDISEGNSAGSAALMIGVLYENGGNGIEKDLTKALEWYEKSLALGHEPAKLHIGILYINGNPPIQKDLQKAYELIHSIEELDYEVVHQVAYKFYLYGWATDIDIDKAKEIALKIPDTQTRINAFQEIKQQENLLITQNKDTMLKNNTINEKSNEPSAEELFNEGKNLYNANEYVKAMITFKKAVEKGSGRAASWIGMIYNKGGHGIDKNVDNAVKWFRKSQEMGYAGANIFLAFSYLNGAGVQKDLNKAYQLVHEVENITLPPDDDLISRNAYRFYIEGLGTPVDFKKAYEIASRIHSDSYREQVIAEIKKYEEASRAIPAKTLIADVRNNQMRFDRTYKGKIIKCEGRVEGVESIRNGYKLNLYYDTFIPNPFEYIECRFSRNFEADLFNLNKGDTVQVQGLYKGKQDFQICALVLFDCLIVK